jgi:hypothetical protein
MVLFSVSISGDTVLYAVQNFTVPLRLSSGIAATVAVASTGAAVVAVGAAVTGVAVGVLPPHALKTVDRASKSAGATRVFRRNIFVSFLGITFNLWIAKSFLPEL